MKTLTLILSLSFFFLSIHHKPINPSQKTLSFNEEEVTILK